MDEGSLRALVADSLLWLDFEVKGDLISLAILGKKLRSVVGYLQK